MKTITIASIRRIRLQPGETLIVKKKNITRQWAEAVGAIFKKCGVEPVIVMDANYKLKIVKTAKEQAQ